MTGAFGTSLCASIISALGCRSAGGVLYSKYKKYAIFQLVFNMSGSKLQIGIVGLPNVGPATIMLPVCVRARTGRRMSYGTCKNIDFIHTPYHVA